MDIQTNLRINGARCISPSSKSEITYLNNLFYDEIEDICNELVENYISNIPSLELKHINKMTNRDAYEKLKMDGHDMKQYEGYNEYPDNGIKPDGGIILLNEYNADYNIIKTDIVFAGELKRQGSNDRRIKEGKKKQAIGNAIERLGKNSRFIETLSWDEEIYPYMIFVSGCDVKESFFLNKLVQINNGRDVNTYNLYKEDGKSSITFIIQENNFDSKTFREHAYPFIIDSLLYFLKKKNIKL